MKKKVVIIGGSGTIGKVLNEGLNEKYEVIILDKQKPSFQAEFIEVDATNFDQLLECIPGDSDALVNLLTIKTEHDLEVLEEFHKMTEIHFIASFYILRAAVELEIPKIVYASSNHTTDRYEREGRSTFGREINISDYPNSRGLYGVLKLASESIGHIFSKEIGYPHSVINLRIGTVVPYEKEAVKENERLRHTLLSHTDAVQLFDLAIESTVKYGTYYGVSDNPDKPWTTENAWKELGFISKVNAIDVSKE
ncbi:NAD(P)-dependent oxidoreductase [Bacillus sp. E214]|uniref:NAD-dependent epimerase/dehydratase family protein n=1 Tax=Bacillus sp. E214 TaxID=2587156 RepID=UPI0011DF22A8|nr:NAD(P)-dependent oxidoreductase [Bacillus sp. E214]